jgi:23S rRNA (guanosine2251-2'-O)-methyltransferase
MNEDNLIYGTRAVIEAVREGKEIEKLYIQRGLHNPLISELKKELKDSGIFFSDVPPEKLNRLTGKNHQGVVAVLSSIIYHSIELLLPQIFETGEIPLLIMLDRVTDVRNMGAIVRTAECVGAQTIILPSRGGALINSDAIKTSAGALHRVPVCREDNLKLTLEYLSSSGLQIIACTEKSGKLIYNVDFTVPCVIIMGSEEDGISGEYLKRADEKVKIPLEGNIASLNVSVATGVILYEVLRQRTFAK